MANYLLLETGDRLLLETGDGLLLEDQSGSATPVTASDSLLPKLAEGTANLLALLARAETLTPRLDDVRTLVGILARTETLTPRLDEATANLLGFLISSDAVLPRLDEIVALQVLLARADVLTPRLDETTLTLVVTLTTGDIVLVRVDDVAQGQSVSSVDTLTPRLDEIATVLVRLDLTDDLRVALEEVLAVQGVINAVDVLLPRLDDGLAEQHFEGHPMFDWRRINGRWNHLPGEAQISPDLGEGANDPIPIADDSSHNVVIPSDLGIFSVACSNPAYSATIGFSRLGGEAVTKLSGGAGVDVLTVPLTGITGADGNVTYAFDDATGFWIENRTGGALRFFLNVTTRGVEG